MSTTRSDVLDPQRNDQAVGYVLPKPGRGGAEIVVGESAPGALQRHRDADVARSIGARVSALVECQQQFLGELRNCLCEVEDSVGEAARVRLQGQVRSALSVLDWCDAVQADLRSESAWAERGLQPIELPSFCDELAARWSVGRAAVQVTGNDGPAWWGHAGRLAETIEAGLALVADRSGGQHGLTIEVEARRGAASIRLAGKGGPNADVDATLVRVFRQNADRLGARVAPDALGPAGTGIVLALPHADD